MCFKKLNLVEFSKKLKTSRFISLFLHKNPLKEQTFSFVLIIIKLLQSQHFFEFSKKFYCIIAYSTALSFKTKDVNSSNG